MCTKWNLQENDAFNRLVKSGDYFIYNLDELRRHVNVVNSGNAKVFFACKANPLSDILLTLRDAEFCFDVSSEGELYQVLTLGVPGDKIIVTGPVRSSEFINLALQHNVSAFVVESLAQLETLQNLARDYSFKPSILLRLQLKWENSEKNVLGGDKITQFGMDLDTANEIMQKITLPFLGFHVFQWSNIKSADILEQIWSTIIKTCRSLTADYQVLDLGGGLGITYSDEDEQLEWKSVNSILERLKSIHRIPELWLEMGRYIVGPYGIYVTSVVDRKQTYGKDMLVLKNGINHLARSALVNETFPVKLLRDSKASSKLFSLYGPLCTSLDFLGEHMLPSDVSIGDAVMLKQTGAYGFTESMPFFLCHKIAGEAIIKNGELSVVRNPKLPTCWLT